MISFLIIVNLIASALIMPGWRSAEKEYRQSLWPFAVPWIGSIVWLSLYALGFGAENIANISVETFIIFISALALAYTKFLILDHIDSLRDAGALIAVASIIFLTIALRFFIPEFNTAG